MVKEKPKYDFGTHEALHASWIAFDSFESYVCEHKAVIANKAWKKQAQKVLDEMFKLYQMIGITHP